MAIPGCLYGTYGTKWTATYLCHPYNCCTFNVIGSLEVEERLDISRRKEGVKRIQCADAR